jgi:hypothetical protein
MKKIKTSLSLEADHLARLKRLAESERRSLSKLVELVLENILPILEMSDEQFGRFAAAMDRAIHGVAATALPDIAFPKPDGEEGGAAELSKARAGFAAKLRGIAK